MKHILHLLSYHNAFPITLVLVSLGAGVTFAANPDIIFSQEDVAVAIDNTYLVNTDLSVYAPSAQVAAVTEDEDAFYVTYDLTSIALVDSVWREATKRETLSVSKMALAGQDLGLYTLGELKQRTARERERLERAQAIEREHVSYKQVATKYGGLIGKMLNDNTETLPGYVPVVKPAPPATSEATVLPIKTPAMTPILAPSPTNGVPVLPPSTNPSSTPTQESPSADDGEVGDDESEVDNSENDGVVDEVGEDDTALDVADDDSGDEEADDDSEIDEPPVADDDSAE